MSEDIKVYVIKYRDRENLVMRYLDPLTNKHVTRSTRTTKKKEAAKVAAKWEAELQEGRYCKPSSIGWAAFRELHENEAQATLQPNTQRKYDTTFDLVERILKPISPSKVTTQAVSRWISELLSEGRQATTVAAYCRHLRAAMNWAAEMGYVQKAPKVKTPKIGDTSRLMKGRAITPDEYERILACLHEVVPADQVDCWERYLAGLWWSGLRLGESLNLSWDISSKFAVLFSRGRAVFQVQASGQKSRKSQLVPCAPEFSEMLSAVPKRERSGLVFQIQLFDGSGTMNKDRVGAIVGDISGAAGVVVDATTGKHATAHDFRRSFGTRWSKRVRTPELQKLMRHSDIKTTLKYYVDQDADDINESLWDAYASSGSILGTNGAHRPTNTAK